MSLILQSCKNQFLIYLEISSDLLIVSTSCKLLTILESDLLDRKKIVKLISIFFLASDILNRKLR